MKKHNVRNWAIAVLLTGAAFAACNEEKKEETPAPAAIEAPAADTTKKDSLPPVDTTASPRTDPIKTLR